MTPDIKKLLDEAFAIDDFDYGEMGMAAKVGAETAHDHIAPLAKEIILELVETLAFYRDENNWIKGFDEACSPIVADTGTKAKQTLASVEARLKNLNNPKED